MPSAGRDGPVPEDEAAVGCVFEIEVAVVSAVGQRFCDKLAEPGLRDLEQLQVMLLRVYHRTK